MCIIVILVICIWEELKQINCWLQLLKFIKKFHSMSYYYDPFYPSLEATRMEIQRSFLALEEKLRVQRQLDLELDADHRLRRERAMDLASYQDELRLRQNMAKNDYLYDRVYDRDMADRVKYAQQEEQHNLRYLSKLERLERERLQLSRERPNKSYDLKADYSGTRSPYKNISPAGYQNQQDDRLIRKYEDGTRARQLKQDIISRSKYNSASKNRPQGVPENNRSPYRNLDFGSTSKPFSNQKLSHLNQNYQNIQGVRGQRQYGGKSEHDLYRRDDDDSMQPRFGSGDQRKVKFEGSSNNFSQGTGTFINRSNVGSGAGSNQKGSNIYNSLPNEANAKNSSGAGLKGTTDQPSNRKERNGGQPQALDYAKNQQGQKEYGISQQQQSGNQKIKNSQSNSYYTAGTFQPNFKGQSFGTGKYDAYNSSKTPNKSKLSSRGRSRSQKQLTNQNKQKQGLSPYCSFFDPTTDRSPKKTKSRREHQNNNNNNSSKISRAPAQQSALQKIKNRLKLSEVVYEDSAYHNTKHELNHLYNTYDCQCRLRKQLKMKINNHPAVLRKHAMVVQ